MEKKKALIQIDDSLKSFLDQEKLISQEPYNNVVKRLISKGKENLFVPIKLGREIASLSKNIEDLKDPQSDYIKSLESKLIQEREELIKLKAHQDKMSQKTRDILDRKIKEQQDRLLALKDKDSEIYKEALIKNTPENEIKRAKSNIEDLVNSRITFISEEELTEIEKKKKIAIIKAQLKALG